MFHLIADRRFTYIALLCALLAADAVVLNQRLRYRGSAGSVGQLWADDAGSCADLQNEESHFTVQIGVGTPFQKFNLVADTGSDQVIVKSCICGNFSAHCAARPECFQGTNRSSTFVPPVAGWQDSLIVHSFGSGDIVTSPATDVVQVGRVHATMEEGLMLMIDRKLYIPSDFEGILGLGLPSWAIPGSKQKGADHKHFLEVAKVKSFSICFSDVHPGALQFEPEPAKKMLKHVGLYHWGLDFQGFSVGYSDIPVSICDPSKKKAHQDSACGAIPDSGTTFLMGPSQHVNKMYADICQGWPRCKQAVMEAERTHYEAMPLPGLSNKESLSVMFFLSLLRDCNGWLMSGEGGINELPSLFVHVGGSDGQTDILELPSSSYISTTTVSNTSNLANLTRNGTASFLSTRHTVCEPLMGEFEYTTDLHGPVWILGTPIFFEYQVVFGMNPAAIGFKKGSCERCSQESPLAKGAAKAHFAASPAHAQRAPRHLSRKPRMPHINVKQPF